MPALVFVLKAEPAARAVKIPPVLDKIIPRRSGLKASPWPGFMVLNEIALTGQTGTHRSHWMHSRVEVSWKSSPMAFMGQI